MREAGVGEGDGDGVEGAGHAGAAALLAGG